MQTRDAVRPTRRKPSGPDPTPPWRRRARRAAIATVTAAVAGLLAGTVPPAAAQPDGIRSTRNIAERIGTLSAQLADADGDLRRASITASLAVEHYERAAVEQRRAAKVLTAARAQRDAADRVVRHQRRRLNAVIRDTYKMGGMAGLTGALLDQPPSEALRNLAYLDYVGDKQARALGQFRQAKGAALLTEGGARSALRAMTTARRQADRARHSAEHAVEVRKDRVAALRSHRESLRAQLKAIEAHNRAVHAAAARAARRHAAALALARKRASAAAADARSEHTRTRTVVRSALDQIGKPYVWAAANPGVGFDCSGLVLYAYRQIGIELPHSAQYQYLRGRHVASSQLRPGDLLFYSSDGTVDGIHHVTMYIGHGQVVQAADFGIPIQVVPAYFNFGYIGATRLV